MEYQEGAAEKQRQQLAVRVSVVCTAVNLLLAAFKFAAGIWGKSSAMISDGVDSATDAISAVAVSAGVRMARKKSDQNHQYGHERLECIVSILLAMGLFLTGGGIGLDAASKIIRALSGNAEVLSVPTLLPLIAAMMSIAVKLYPGRRPENGLPCADGQCLELSERCVFLVGKPGRYRRRKAGASDPGPGCVSGNLPADPESGL